MVNHHLSSTDAITIGDFPPLSEIIEVFLKGISNMSLLLPLPVGASLLPLRLLVDSRCQRRGENTLASTCLPARLPLASMTLAGLQMTCL
ncbi:uncharacterized protein Dvir_GJ26145 [Drosophila virilis]|uniref:Uncharacterized protein n=1 Tax=Drosophila virilis TaxID=7244 RepID=A0A0Q9W820_DROVI|nr:uncharacterized protein Dvir_GJ26145 [Drosophila virilis]